MSGCIGRRGSKTNHKKIKTVSELMAEALGVQKIQITQASYMRYESIVETAIGLVKSAKCRIGEGASQDKALISKDKLNRLKRELRAFAPGCLGKE